MNTFVIPDKCYVTYLGSSVWIKMMIDIESLIESAYILQAIGTNNFWMCFIYLAYQIQELFVFRVLYIQWKNPSAIVYFIRIQLKKKKL